MPYWRSKYLWAPLYLFLLCFLLINFGRKGGFLVVTALLTIVIADTVSSQLLKKQVQRLRPCRTEQLAQDLHLLVPCGSGYSFPSSHATNHFALALLLIVTLRRRFRWIVFPLLLWAASIALGQVYVGVHFPLDVIGGALLGTAIGSAMGYWFRRVHGPI